LAAMRWLLLWFSFAVNAAGLAPIKPDTRLGWIIGLL
jgi:hypothetical protein